MINKLLIALRLKKPQPKLRPPEMEAFPRPPREVGGMHHAGYVRVRPMPPPAPPRRTYTAPAMAPSQAPAPHDDFAGNMLLYSMLASRSEPTHECRRDPEPEPVRAGGGGDFGGGGATGSWEPPAASPSYESSSSSYSYSSSSDSSSSSSTSSE